MANIKNVTKEDQTSAARFKRLAWLMLLSFGFTYLFFYNGRQNINLVMTQMAEELGSTTTALGVVSSALFWCYAFGQLINGRLGAFFGYKRFMIIGVVSSAALNVIISFQHSIPVIAILWGLNGFFQSMVWSNGLGVVNKWWPKKKRGFATGLATFFSGMAQVVTYLTILFCLEWNPEWGWRAAFRYPMIPMLLMLIAFFFFFHNSPKSVGLADLEEEDDERDVSLEKEIQKKGYLYPYKMLFSEPKVLVFCLISAIAGIGRYGLLTWVPTYFTEELGLTIKDGIFSSILLPFGQACAMFIFPIITDKFLKGKREPMLIIASLITFLGMIVFPFVKVQAVASVMLFVLGVFAMVTGVIWTIAGDIGGKAFSSTVIGVFDWAVYMGAAIQAVIFGFIKDTFGWPAIFIVIGSLYIIMLVLAILTRNMKTKRI
ncbi:MAG: MFS transporter [Oscillospiraceae bacterium]|nr:MFS transporter [Oscillospiraceae bacterium]MBQ4101584.1 MFS transporter [Oscillospiraceae bacterium]